MRLLEPYTIINSTEIQSTSEFKLTFSQNFTYFDWIEPNNRLHLHELSAKLCGESSILSPYTLIITLHANCIWEILKPYTVIRVSTTMKTLRVKLWQKLFQVGRVKTVSSVSLILFFATIMTMVSDNADSTNWMSR